MEFPRFVYRSPGQSKCAGGASYTLELVNSKQELDEKIKSGWFTTVEKAVQYAGDEAFLFGLNRHRRAKVKKLLDAKKKATAVRAPEPAEENASPPTRAELEQMATKLELRFDGRTTDAKLARKIDLALMTKGG